MSEEQIIFRPKRTTRYLFLAAAIVVAIVASGAIAFSVFLLVRFKDALASQFTGSLWIAMGIAMALIAGMVYLTAYWWKYSIVVGKTYIAREGIPHLAERRQKIAFTEINRITHGDRSVLKIVPWNGPAMSVNLSGLEGEPTALLDALRERIPGRRFERDLNSKIFESNRLNRTGVLIIAASLLIGGLPLAALYVRDPILADIAWFEVGPVDEGLRILKVETSSDGSVWLASERRGSRRDDELVLTRVQLNGEAESIEVSSVPVLFAALKEADPIPRVLDSFVVDSKDRPWLLFNGGKSAFVLDDSEWKEVLVAFGTESYEITNLVRAGNYLWARVPEREALLRIDDKTLELNLVGPLSTGEGDGAVELKPRKLRGTARNGAILIGEYSTGPTGLLYIDHEGTARFMTPPLGGPSESAWRARGAVADDFGRIHVYYSSREVCVAGRRMIKVGTRLENAEWVWRDLVYEADCDIDPIFDDIELDTTGRVWVRPENGDLLVFAAPSGDIDETAANYLTSYSRGNSGYNGGELFRGQDGHMLAIGGIKPQIMQIDAGGPELPLPLSRIAEEFLERPYLFQFAIVIIVLPFAVVAARRKFGR